MKKFSLLVAVCAAILTTSCQSTRQQQSASVYAPGARDIVVNMNGQQEARKKSPGNTAQIASQRRDDVTLLGAPAPVVRRSSGSVGGSSYRRPAPPSAPVPTGQHITGYHVERRWRGEHVTIPPGAKAIGGGVVEHWTGWGQAPDGSREGRVVEQWGYQVNPAPWKSQGSSSSTWSSSSSSSGGAVNRFGYGD